MNVEDTFTLKLFLMHVMHAILSFFTLVCAQSMFGGSLSVFVIF